MFLNFRSLFLKLSYWLPVFLWMGIIFTFSSLTAAKSSEVYLADFVIKKTVHMIEYGVLWFLTTRALRASYPYSVNKVAWMSFIFVVLYAISDEWHQTFVPSREGTVRDVLIDATGVSVTFIIFRFTQKTKLMKQLLD